MLVLIFYPFVVGFGTFWFIDPFNQTNENLFKWIGVLFITAAIGSSYGFMVGCLFDNDQVGIIWMLYTVIVFDMGAGIFTNLRDANFVVKFLSYISPLNFANQLLMSRLLDLNPSKDIALEYYDFTYKESTCILVLIGYGVLYFLIGWVLLYIKSRKI